VISATEIRFSDMDAQGHVGHLPIIEWIAHARVKFIDATLAEAGLGDIDHVLVHLDIDFTSGIKYPGEIDVGISVFGIGRTSLSLAYGLTKDGETFATADSVSVFFEGTSGDKISIPSSLKRALGNAEEKK
jgi:acyl-CoA thioester hydrolase